MVLVKAFMISSVEKLAVACWVNTNAVQAHARPTRYPYERVYRTIQ